MPALIRELGRRGAVQENYAGRSLPGAAGIAALIVSLLALAPLVLLDEVATVDLLEPTLPAVAMLVIGVALLGFLDDLAGAGAGGPRGLRGHGSALAGGTLSTGSIKAVGIVALAGLYMAGQGLAVWRYLVAVGVLALAAHVFNLLDLRPGRAGKVFIALGVVVALVGWTVRPLEITGLFVGPLIALFPYDLSERAMLGDTGAGAMGAVAGLWIVLTASGTVQAVVLAVLATIAIYGELRSLSTLIERTPVLRQLDSLGRPSHA